MGAGIFLLLFFLGALLALIGGIIGIVDAFSVSPLWGLLSLLVPFALLVFCIKFWRTRRLARISLLTSLGGMLGMALGFPFLRGIAEQQAADLEIPVENVPLDQIPIPDAEEGVFTEPLVPAAPQLSAIASADLIQSTDPNERLQQVESSRPDPFATVPIPPPPQVAPPPAPGSPVAGGPGVGGAPGQGNTTPAPGGAGSPGVTTTPPAPGGSQPGINQPGGGNGIALAPLPPLPQPTQAEAVVVTGVVTVGGRNYAIVQSPDEPTGRYVAVGQRIAGGQVLVKRIEMGGSEPVVVLEQNGIEVARSVGSPSDSQETASSI
ncbi:MAG: hypothetical protein HC929_24165 [Leptolyngbyaceae cyanobacterium SM2_5_2]|nr:hypothetical protein [Leptolyngbyaceae cyanobacterium SM2_5_2]